jgi:hypothetical protein
VPKLVHDRARAQRIDSSLRTGRILRLIAAPANQEVGRGTVYESLNKAKAVQST